MPDFPIVTLKPEPFAYLTITTTMPEIPKAMGNAFDRLATLFAEAGATMAGMPLCHYIAYDEKTTTFQLGFPALPAQVEALRAVGLEIGETPAGRNMKAVHMGPYDTVVSTYDAMMAQMKAQKLEGARDMWEIYHSPPETPPKDIKTEVLWPVSQAA